MHSCMGLQDYIVTKRQTFARCSFKSMFLGQNRDLLISRLSLLTFTVCLSCLSAIFLSLSSSHSFIPSLCLSTDFRCEVKTMDGPQPFGMKAKYKPLLVRRVARRKL